VVVTYMTHSYALLPYIFMFSNVYTFHFISNHTFYTVFVNEFIVTFEISYYILQLYVKMTITINVLKTFSFCYCLQYMLHSHIICWFYSN